MKTTMERRSAPSRRGGDPLAAILASLSGDPRFASLLEQRRKSPAAGSKFGANALKVGGKIFAMSVDRRLVVKLPAARVAALVAARKGTNFEPRPGRLMKEWISVPITRGDAADLVKEAFEFVGGRKRPT
jgi:hypothetical protein